MCFFRTGFLEMAETACNHSSRAVGEEIVRTFNRFRNAMPLLSLTVFMAPAHADCRQDFLAIADAVCGDFAEVTGSSSKSTNGAGAEARINGLLGKILDLGANVDTSRTRQEYQNFLQEDLPEVVAQNARCRLDLYDRICGTGPAAQAKRGAPEFSQAGRLARPDGIDDKRIFMTPLFSGPGENYKPLKLLTSQQDFRTHTQTGKYWKIRTSDGIVGWLPAWRIEIFSQ